MNIYKCTEKNTKVYFIKNKDKIYNLEYIVDGVDLKNKSVIEKINLLNNYKDNIKIIIFISSSNEIIEYNNITNLEIIDNNLLKFISKNQSTITEKISNLLYFSTFSYR